MTPVPRTGTTPPYQIHQLVVTRPVATAEKGEGRERQGEEAYHRYNLILHSFRKWYYVKETGDVELVLGVSR